MNQEEGRVTFRVAHMQQQKEVRKPDDDWTGLSDAAERRKRQNRLNQRIYRRRRRYKPELLNSSHPAESRGSKKFTGLILAVNQMLPVEDERDGDQTSSIIRRLSTGHGSVSIGRTELAIIISKYEDLATQNYMLGSPRADQLLTLIQFNVLRALISNTTALGWTLEWLECSNPPSPWNAYSESEDPEIPKALRPSHLQRTVEHHPWIDLWPIPKMRDNLLRAEGYYDEDLLCNALVEFKDIPNEQTGLIVWSDPWDIYSWEISETFLKNWGWTVKGCAELQYSTNIWRLRREEEPLIFIN